MMTKKEIYRVGDLLFGLNMPEESHTWEFTTPYQPFKIESNKIEKEEIELFTINSSDSVSRPEDAKLLIKESSGSSSDGMVRVDIYNTKVGYYFEITPPISTTISAKILFNTQLNSVEMELCGNRREQQVGFTNTMIISYFLTATHHGALILHSSAIIKDGCAYLFLGRSGTGKSTHSRLWMENIEGCELLNDDHPIVRLMPNGEILAFGSPWSGKTHCYKNLKAPLQAVVRLEQAPENRIKRLSIAQSYGSLIASSSIFNWSQELLDSKSKTLGVMLKSLKNYHLECLANSQAANLCYNFVKQCPEK